MKTYEITSKEAGNRLDKVISMLDSTISRTMVQKMLEDKKILVNGCTKKASYKVEEKDKIQVDEIQAKEVDIKPEDIPIGVLYEDKDMIVVNKPKGLVVHPANGNPDGTLVNAIMNICQDSLSGIGGQIRPGIVHRLDKDTSGVLMIAKNDQAHINLSNQIKNREVNKIYVALVRGNIKEKEATIDMPIGRSTKDRKKMAVSKKGKEAITHFTVIKKYQNYTLLQIKIDTGRTHQIRVHMAEIGHPVIGDVVYSNGKNPFGVVGQMLHAKSIEFKHPVTNQTIKIEAPLPDYFQQVLEQLDKSKEESWN